MIAREDGTITFTYPSDMPTTKATSISYSVNDAEWVTKSNVDETEVTVPVTVVSGDKVRWKGDNVVMCYDGWLAGSTFVSDCEVDLNGNIMSLLYGDDFKDETAFNAETQRYVFAQLFGNYDGFLKVVNAKNLSLPATTLSYGCYSCMFDDCTSLTTAPELPATTLSDECYISMFRGCTSLTTPPELPATTLGQWCYRNMFSGCISLTTAPELPATTLVHMCYDSMFRDCTSLTTAIELPATTLANYCYNNMFYGTNVLPDCTNIDFTSETVVASGGLRGLFAGTKVTYSDLERILPKDTNNKPCLPVTTLANYCYESMFQGCTNLTTAPELPATTLAGNCYDSMFYGCTSLTTAPELPATTLANYCYDDMFDGCTNLTTAPELPATTLWGGCYRSMFKDCTSLTTAPVLPAKRLYNYCYQYMFNGCTSLNYIKAMFTTTPSTTYTGYWVYNVSSTGTFVKNSSATWEDTYGNGAIPSGWTVETASA